MFAGVLDRVRMALGRPTEWERRTKTAVMDSHQLIFDARGRDEFMEPSAFHYEPAVVHKPTGWLLVFPLKDGGNRVRWRRTPDDRFTLDACAVRLGVRLETLIIEPGTMTATDLFDSRVQAAAEAVSGLQVLQRTPPGDDLDTPGVFDAAFDRNGAPQVARMISLTVKGHVIEITYDTPARLAGTAAALLDQAVAIGLENVRNPPGADWPEPDPEEMAEAMRGFGMSEDEIAKALKDREITQP